MRGKRRGYKGNFECFLVVPEDAIVVQRAKRRKKLLFHNRDPTSSKWCGPSCLYTFETRNQTLDKLRLEKTRTLPQI